MKEIATGYLKSPFHKRTKIYKGHNNNKKFPTGRYRHNDEYIASVGLTVQCVNYATKLTKDMVQWMTDKDDEYFILDIDV